MLDRKLAGGVGVGGALGTVFEVTGMSVMALSGNQFSEQEIAVPDSPTLTGKTGEVDRRLVEKVVSQVRRTGQ
jgi:hypothetical protein